MTQSIIHKFLTELIREGGMECGVVSMTITEKLYQRIFYDLYTNYRFPFPNIKYGTPLYYQFYNYCVEIKPDTVDRELKEIWNGERKVCW